METCTNNNKIRVDFWRNKSHQEQDGNPRSLLFSWIKIPSFSPKYKHGTHRLCWGYTVITRGENSFLYNIFVAPNVAPCGRTSESEKIPLASSVTGCKLMTYGTRGQTGCDAMMRFALWKRFSTHQEIRSSWKNPKFKVFKPKKTLSIVFCRDAKGEYFP